MAGIGSEAVGGLAALQASIRQRIADQIAEQQRQLQNTLAVRGADRADQQLAETSALRQAQQDESMRTHQANEADRVFRENMTLNESIPANTDIPGSSPVVGRLQAVGAVRPQPLDVQAPPSALTADPNAGPSEMPGTIANSPSPVAGRLFRKNATTKQEADAAARVDKQTAEARAQENVSRQWATDAERARHDRAMENKPSPVSTVMIQTVDANGNPVTRVVPKADAIGKDFAKPVATPTVVVQTVDDKGQAVTKIVPKTAGASYAKAPNAVTANRLDSAKAVNQTGEDIIAHVSDPSVAAMLGPAMGRYNSVREFIGNPPPELAELAGQIESYALANMGVHGMRSTQGAEEIKKLLDRKHTPQSLVSTIRGLNKFSSHFLENAGRGTTGGGDTPPPSAADLIKKYGGKP